MERIRERNRTSPTITTQQRWAAAYLLVHGLHEFRATRAPHGRIITFTFSDPEGRGPDLLRAFAGDARFHAIARANKIIQQALSAALNRDAGWVESAELYDATSPACAP